MRRRSGAFFSRAAIVACGLALGLEAKGYRVEDLKEAAPGEVAEKLRAVLGSTGLRILDPKGQPFADLWLRKEVPTVEAKQELGVKFGQLEEGTFLGVLRFHQPGSDFKGNAFPAGAYTFRNALQPRDGDHLGVSATRDFVLLSPVKVDSKLEPVPHKELIKLSVQVSGLEHPTVLYLLRSADGEEKLPRMIEGEDGAQWMLDCTIPIQEKGKDRLRLGIVLVGKAAES